ARRQTALPYARDHDVRVRRTTCVWDRGRGTWPVDSFGHHGAAGSLAGSDTAGTAGSVRYAARQRSIMTWHQMDTSAVLRRLVTDPGSGLSEQEAARRLAQYGRNEVTDSGTRSPWRILWEQVTSMMAVILIAAASVSVPPRSKERCCHCRYRGSQS